MADVVADASVAAKWILEDEEHREQALLLRRDILAGTYDLVLPWFWDYEVSSIFSKAVWTKRLGPSDARIGAEALLDFPARTAPIPIPLEAFENALRFRRTVIDSFYLALAEERGCDFWTDDRKLVRAVSAAFPFVRWIGDYPSPAAASNS